jgi:arylsulfatase A-like enzyme
MDNNTRRPNILFLMTDQHRWDALGYLNHQVKTPNLDKLASRGITFSQAICNGPMCVPSRYSMMTGLYPSQNGVRHNTQMCKTDTDMNCMTIAQRLRIVGYHSAGIGKLHWYVNLPDGVPPTTVVPSTRGFDIRVGRDGKNPAYLEPGTIEIQEEDEIRNIMKNEGRNFRSGGENALGYKGLTIDTTPEKKKEGLLTEKALEFLDTQWNRRQPFFLYLSFDAPHPPFVVPKAYEEMYNIEDIKIPVISFDKDRLSDHYIQPKNVIEWEKWNQEFSEEEKKRSILRYYALCTYADAMFGRVLKKIVEMGEWDNTFILFTSDHGDMLGERGRFSKYSMYEGSIRVPLIISGCGIKQGLRGTKDERPASLVDVMPTLLDAAGEPVDSGIVGHSLLGVPKNTGAFAEMHGSGYHDMEKPPIYMWRTGEWKLILYQRGIFEDLDLKLNEVRGELYQIKQDPLEYTNLYDDKSCLEIREKLTRDLLVHLAIAWSRFPRPFSHTSII